MVVSALRLGFSCTVGLRSGGREGGVGVGIGQGVGLR